jgi:cystathionine gamma-lyase
MKPKFETIAVHAGIEPEALTGAVMTPIFQTSTYAQTAPGEHKGYEYSRTDNPTRTVLQTQLAALEGAEHALVFATGMASIDAVLNLLSSGDHVIAGDDLYGGTRRLFSRIAVNRGLTFTFVDLSDLTLLEVSLLPNTKLIWCETPTNPMLKIINLQEIANFAKKNGLISAVDNTFMSPYFQNPLSFGIDIAMHSLTKYVNGHSDVVMGALMFSDSVQHIFAEEMNLYQRLKFLQNSIGAVPGPFDCWLVLRGVKTLAVRMDRIAQNAQRIAEYLESHSDVAKAIFPGLKSHPSFELGIQQMRGSGGMISFIIKGDKARAEAFLSSLKIFAIAESLGGVESLAEHPGIMTHASVPAKIRKELGIDDSMIRLSVGIEAVEDLIADLEQAFKATS